LVSLLPLTLQTAEFLYETRLMPEPTYTFKHVPTQEVTYNSVVLERRQVLHACAAQAVEELYAGWLPEHYHTLAQAISQKEIPYSGCWYRIDQNVIRGQRGMAL